MNDLSSTPALPAEAHQPTVINRLDYTPPAWLVPQIALDFALSLDATRVLSTLSVERNAANPSPTLRLNGDGIAARSVNVDGATPHPANVRYLEIQAVASR